MKNLIAISIVASSIIASAQTPFVSSSQRATNSVSVTITEIYEQAQVSVLENGQLIPFPPPFPTRLVSRTIVTNAPVTQTPKPLLSAQQPPPKVATPQAKIPGPIPPPPTSNSMAYVNWAMRNNVTNALPPMAPTNSPIFRRFADWKKTTK